MNETKPTPTPKLVAFETIDGFEICIAATPGAVTPWLHVGWVNEEHYPSFATRMIQAVNSYDTRTQELADLRRRYAGLIDNLQSSTTIEEDKAKFAAADKLKRDRDALLEALKTIADFDNGFGTLQEHARAAIAQAESED